MTDESAQTIVTLLMRIESRLDAIEKRLDAAGPVGNVGRGAGPGGVDRRAAQQPIDHEDRRKLSGEL